MPHTLRQLLAAALMVTPLIASAGPLSSDEPVVSTGSVSRTIDGDTFEVSLDDPEAYARLARQAAGHADRERYLNDRFQSTRVRLASVDTPESVHRDGSRNSEEGKRASDIVREMVEGKQILATCYDWGYYGRTICNLAVAHEGDWADLGGWLISSGISPYLTDFGNNPYFHSEYKALEASASQRP